MTHVTNRTPATPIIQTNLKKKVTATTNILKDLKTTTILMLTEPYVSKHRKLAGIPSSHKAFLDSNIGKPRAAIVVPLGLHKFSIRLGQYSNSDITTIRITLGNKVIVLCSCYLDINFTLPDPTIEALCNHCNTNNIPLIIATDTNSRHTVWGDKLTNPRGRKLLEFISSQSLHISNKGTDPTFRSKQGSSLIDLTLFNNSASNIIQGWNSSFEHSDSDHAKIYFDLDLIPPLIQPYRNPNNCDWDLFNRTVTDSLQKDPFRFVPTCNKAFLNKLNNKITDTLLSAFNIACPLKFTRLRSSAPWWTLELSTKRRSVRILHRKARRLKTDHLWTLYRQGQTEYKKIINNSKSKHWKAHTDKINSLPSAAKLHNFLKNRNTPTPELGTITLPNGTSTASPKETLEALATALLPNDEPAEPLTFIHDAEQETVINKLITPQKLNKVCKEMP